MHTVPNVNCLKVKHTAILYQYKPRKVDVDVFRCGNEWFWDPADERGSKICQKSSLHEEIGGIGFHGTTELLWGHAANRINHSFKRSSAVAISKPLRFRFSFYSGDQLQVQVTQREVFRRLSAAHFIRFDAVTECGHHE